MNEEEQPEAVVEAPAPPGAPAEAAAAPEFAFGTLPPEISFATRQVQPPAESYVGPGFSLMVQAWNRRPGGGIWVDATILGNDGQIRQSRWMDWPTSDGVANLWSHGLCEGFLLTLALFTAHMQSGECYVRAWVDRGGIPQQILASGYLVRWSALCWPYPRYVGPCEGPGCPRIIVGTDPAPGVQILEEVPAGVRWRLLSILAPLTTSPVVASRYVILVLGDPATMWWVGSALAVQPASVQRNYSWAIGVDARVSVLPEWIQDRLPDRITLSAGWGFFTTVVNMQAGDNWAAPQYYVEEWVEP